MVSGVQPFHHPNCYHQLVFVKFDLLIYYSPLKKEQYATTAVNADFILRSIDQYD